MVYRAKFPSYSSNPTRDLQSTANPIRDSECPSFESDDARTAAVWTQTSAARVTKLETLQPVDAANCSRRAEILAAGKMKIFPTTVVFGRVGVYVGFLEFGRPNSGQIGFGNAVGLWS